MQEEEARETELVDEPELVLEPLLRLAVESPAALCQFDTWVVALLERVPADRRELADRRLAPVGEVGIAVAELLRQVELEP